jgi:hypothetical protein
LLKCIKTQKLREKFLNDEWLHINREEVYQKIIGNKKFRKLKTFGKCLYKLKCSLENIVKNCEISEGNERGGIPNRNILWYRKKICRFELISTYQI